MSGIYIHIPFCKQACSYCDFYFVTRDRLIPEFVDALVHEITAVPAGDGSPFPGDAVRTLYLGGGTPSRLPLSQLERIFDALHRHFDLSGLTECTAEMNPEDVTAELLAGLRGLGVTRLSMGIQSFQPELLEFMHRAHSAPEAHRALESVVRAGFTSFSVDLIYGCPGQTEAQLQDDLDQLLAYDPPHLSAYSLTIEPRTRLGKQAELGRLKPADDETVVRQSRLIRDVLGANGIHQYEISNYARHGHEAEHNSAYWCHENYLGMGPAAHSFYWPGAGEQRTGLKGLRRAGLTGGRRTGLEGGRRTGLEGEQRTGIKRIQEVEALALRWYQPADIHAYGRLVRSDSYRTWLDRVLSGAQGYPSGETSATVSGCPASPEAKLPADSGFSAAFTVPPDGLKTEQLSLQTLADER
ncbi:MAG: radical SAM family heme chaperone HemW, partial [Balneolaceae bacterium]